MKLTMRETKQRIKNNETVQFTIDSYLKNVALNKKVYKRFVKAIAQRIKSFYPEFTTAQILDILDRLKVLPDVSKFDDEGYFMHNGRKEYSSNSTFEIKGKTFNAVSFNRNADYFELDNELGVKLDDNVAVTDPYTNHFAILVSDPSKMYHITDNDLPLYLRLAKKSNGTFNIAVDETVFAGTKSKLVKLDQQRMIRQKYELEMAELRKQVIELNEVIAPTAKELSDKFSEKVIKSQKVVSSKIVRDSFQDIKQKFNQSISKKLGVDYDYYSVELSTPIRWPQEGEYGGALYREYDGTLHAHHELGQKYIEKNYSKQIKTLKAEVEKLNKKMTAKSPIQFEAVYGIAIGDKTSNIYADIALKKLPQEIDAKYLKKMESLFK
nr:MAG TPA: hypothetical protein [Bacteriophage sp.]